MVFEHGLLAGDTPDHLPTVAARRTPADFIGLDNMNSVTAFRQMQRRGYSCETRTNHTNIGFHRTGQRGKIGVVICACGVVRLGMRLGIFHSVVTSHDKVDAADYATLMCV